MSWLSGVHKCDGDRKRPLLNYVRFFARIYTKGTRQVVRGVGPDEWFALITLVGIPHVARRSSLRLLTRPQIITAGVTTDIIVGNGYGMGRHLSLSVTPAQLVPVLKVHTFSLRRAFFDERQLTSCSWSSFSYY